MGLRIMTCPVCSLSYDTIACPGCAERRSRAALRAFQPQFLTKAFSGQLDLKLARKTHGKLHVQLFGDRDHAFCGESLLNYKRSQTAYSMLPLDMLCEACAKQIAELMQISVEAL